MKIKKTAFGKAGDKPVFLYTIQNSAGFTLDLMTYGGTIVRFVMPDKKGNPGDVVLGFSDLDQYMKKSPYFGCIIGRYGNRIAEARFSLDGREYQLAKNDGPNSLHGGNLGFDKRVWDAKEVKRQGAAGVGLSYRSLDGEEGFPGNLDVKVTYWLTEGNELEIEYRAQTDKPTTVNLTNHAYWNLGGEGSGDILSHEMTIYSNYFTPVDKTLIPTGELAPVAGTPFDFTQSRPVGSRIDQNHPQLSAGGGYDHNFVVRKNATDQPVAAAVCHCMESGRIMEVLTTEPGVQFYSGNFLNGSLVGKSGKTYEKRSGFCLETQHYPDSPNKPQFPGTTLRPGERYYSKTVHRFSVM
ncbi:MAG: galactose mutarotase [Spirochaetaceae bacterium]|nr:MAG: galactose mutarotase [Spirochaetaceae bacterium]